MHKAIANDDVEKMAWFIENGMDIEEPNHKGERPLLVALDECADQVMKFLLENGATYYIEGENESVKPLCLACAMQDVELVRALLEFGIDPNEMYENEVLTNPCLWLAAKTQNKEIFDLLMAHGADINFKTEIEESAEEDMEEIVRPEPKQDIFVDMFGYFTMEAMSKGKEPFNWSKKEKDMMCYIHEKYQDKMEQSVFKTGDYYIKTFVQHDKKHSK